MSNIHSNIEVLPSGEKWKVVYKGKHTNSSPEYDTKEDALAYATERAKRERGKLIIHSEDGSVEDTINYAHDPSF